MIVTEKVLKCPHCDGDLEALPATLDMICGATAKFYGLDTVLLRGRGRTRKVLVARQVAMYLAREMMRHHSSYRSIRAYFGRTHATALHAVRKIGRDGAWRKRA